MHGKFQFDSKWRVLNYPLRGTVGAQLSKYDHLSVTRLPRITLKQDSASY